MSVRTRSPAPFFGAQNLDFSVGLYRRVSTLFLYPGARLRAFFLPARGERAGLGFGDSAAGDYFFCNVCARIFFYVSENFGIAARYAASFVDANFHSRFFKRLRLTVSAIGIPRGAFDAARISRRFYMDKFYMDSAQILRGFYANFAPANRTSRIRPATADAAFGNFRAFAALLARFQSSLNAVEVQSRSGFGADFL